MQAALQGGAGTSQPSLPHACGRAVFSFIRASAAADTASGDTNSSVTRKDLIFIVRFLLRKRSHQQCEIGIYSAPPGQPSFPAQNGVGALLIVLMDVSACAQRYLQRFASLPRTTTSNRQLLSRSRADLRQTQRHTPKPMLRRWQGMFRQRQTLRRVQFLARPGRLECRLGTHAKELEEYRSLNKTQRAQRASWQSTGSRSRAGLFSL